MTAEERAASFAAVWRLGRDEEAALAELLHQHEDEVIEEVATAVVFEPESVRASHGRRDENTVV